MLVLKHAFRLFVRDYFIEIQSKCISWSNGDYRNLCFEIVVLFVLFWFSFHFCLFVLKLELAERQGVSMNCHYVTTADGYILQLYHIPTPAQNQSNNRTNALKPMLFMHGLQASSLDYIFYPNASAGEFGQSLSIYRSYIIHCRSKGALFDHTQNCWTFQTYWLTHSQSQAIDLCTLKRRKRTIVKFSLSNRCWCSWTRPFKTIWQ